MPTTVIICSSLAVYFVLNAAVQLVSALRRVPVGYQDSRGFHYGSQE